MSKEVAKRAIRGARYYYQKAEEFLNKALKDYEEDTKIRFPNTAYYLPFTYSMLGLKVKTLRDLKEVKKEAYRLISDEPSSRVWLPYLGHTLDAGISTLFSQEIIAALEYLYESIPSEYNGFITDTILRSLGLQLVDGRMPGFAAIIGAPAHPEIAVNIVRQLQEKNILIFLIGNRDGVTMKEILEKQGVELGWETYIVPIGPKTSSSIFVLNWAVRAGLTFGGLKPGERKKCLLYCKKRVFAFVLVLGEIDNQRYATGAGALNLGFPIIADTKGPKIYPSGITTYEALVRELDHQKIVARCIETRGIRIRVRKVPIPVLFGAAFEGERIRKEKTRIEFGGKKTKAFELVLRKSSPEVVDGKIEIIGPKIEDVEVGQALPLGLVIEVYGRKMVQEFEPILERKLHSFFNQAMGILHLGQRSIIWIRISKEAFEKGFRLHHLGEIARYKLLEEFPGIVDKVQVKIYTNLQDVERLLTKAEEVYQKRDQRLAFLKDESVDTFYSCTLCQSFAPLHVCIITPERIGLCGAYNWLDAKAAYEINPNGPNQPIIKGECLDKLKGKWQRIDEFVKQTSQGKVQSISLYSMMDNPMTSCGCFECIVAVLPGTGGVMIVDRDFSGSTPVGMDFSTLAEMVGGGVQTPGFMGIGVRYIISEKFILAEGGLKRIAWMTSSLKERLFTELRKRSQEIGIEGFIEKIADETVTVELEELVLWLQKVKHPCLEMGEII
jgi:acetyl-CoA synthase